MQVRRGWVDSFARGCLFAGALAVPLSIGAAAEDASGELVTVGSSPPGCKSLGAVEGTHYHESPNTVLAKESALRQAKALGATHVQFIDEKSGLINGPYEVSYSVVAYRCPAPASAPQAS